MKNGVKVNIFLFFSLFILTNELFALHIIGGVLSYKCLGNGVKPNTKIYEFQLKMYRDCFGAGAAFDALAPISIYKGTSTKALSTDMVALGSNVIDIQPPSNPCLVVPPNVCVQEGSYVFRKELDISTETYTIAYQRCCRNSGVNNLSQPGNQGITIMTELTPDAQTLCNNSPIFNDFPPIAICVNNPLVFNHAATDAENDQIVYEFCAPFQGGGNGGGGGGGNGCNSVSPNPACPPPYKEVVYNTPTFNKLIPLGGNPILAIDPKTGVITGTPNILGQFVVGVCAKEYRNGVLLSVTRRDFQFNVVACKSLVDAVVSGNEVSSNYVIESCGKDTLTIQNLTPINSAVKSFLWIFNVNNNTITSTDKDLTIDFMKPGTYNGKLIVNPDPGGCTDTAFMVVKIHPKLVADFESKFDTCVAGPVEFKDITKVTTNKVKKWFWSFSDGTLDSVQFFTHRFDNPSNYLAYMHIVDDNKCKDSITKMIDWFPVPPVLIVQPSRYIGCPPIDIEFSNLSKPVDSTYKITWDFGDSTTSNSFKPLHSYTKVGVYSVNVNLVSPIGCKTSKTFNNLIRIAVNPIADFDYSPATNISNINPRVDFTDKSTGAIAWNWTFGEQLDKYSIAKNPTYNFRDTGLHIIRLLITDKNGCTDSLTKEIDVLPEIRFFMPNAFTPNGDGTNELFLPNGFFFGLKNYTFSIWNRWGEKIFETNDINEGWNGRFKNLGDHTLIDGVYQYSIQYIEPRGKVVKQQGFVNLVR